MRTLVLNRAIEQATWDSTFTLADARSVLAEMREGGVTAAEVLVLDNFVRTTLIPLDRPARALLQAAITRGANAPAAPTPARDINYDALLADGRLELSFAFGFDDDGWQDSVIEDFQTGLERRGFHLIDPFEQTPTGPRYSRAQLVTLGINPDTLDRNIRYYAHTDHAGSPTPVHGLSAPVSIRVLLPAEKDASAGARSSIGASLRQMFITSEVFAYSGHGRYGSGPDLDSITSPLGNLRFGTPYEAGHVALGSPAIPSAAMRRPGYQLAMFAGCNTDLYIAPMRRAGLSRAERDIIATNQLTYFDRATQEVDAFLSSMLARDSITQTIEDLNEATGDDSFHADGFGNVRADVRPPH